MLLRLMTAVKVNVTQHSRKVRTTSPITTMVVPQLLVSQSRPTFTVQHLIDVPTSAFKAQPPAKKDQVLPGHIAFPVLSPGISIEAHLHPPWADLRVVAAKDLAGKHHHIRSHSSDVARLTWENRGVVG